MKKLTQFLKKIGVSSFDELNAEEKETYRAWEEALEGRRLTDEDVRQFIQLQREEVIAKLTTADLNSDVDKFLKMELKFINTLIGFLDSPKRERAAVEQFLED